MATSRRAPAPADRKRDAARTREKILDAALVEFSEHGYAGARTAAIAERAGVNQQLISYYFDGKAGLAAALNERWRQISGGLNLSGLPLADILDNFLRYGMDNRAWTRLLAWQGLTGGDADDGDHDDFFTDIVAKIREHQRAGELADDLDPAYLVLVFFAAAMAPVVLPQVARRLTGQSTDSAEFLDAYSTQTRRILDHLRD